MEFVFRFLDRQSIRLIALVSVWLAAPSPTEVGAQTSWTGATGSWFDSINWSNGTPAAGSFAYIDNGGTSQISLNSAITDRIYLGELATGTLQISNGASLSSNSSYLGHYAGSHGTASVSGAGSSWSNSGVSFYVGYEGAGDLTITDGAVVSLSNNSTTIGLSKDSEGIVSVAGAGSKLISKELDVANNGHGTLSITDGGSVTSTVSRVGGQSGLGIAQVAGPGSTWNTTRLLVGYRGNGEVTVSDGAVITSVFAGSSGILGDRAGSHGTVTVTGHGSRWTGTGEFYVGDLGQGELLITNGGTVAHATTWIAASPGSSGSVTVSGQGSVLQSAGTSSGQLTVASSGIAHLTIADGGQVLNSNGIVAASTNGEGVVLVTGPDSKWLSTFDMTIGDRGKGTLTIASGGLVSAGRFATLASITGSTATATVTGVGSKWTYDTMQVGNGGTAQLKIEAGGIATGGVAYLGGDDSFPNTGPGRGDVLVTGAGSQWNNTTRLEVGRKGTGVLTIADGGVVSNGIGMVGNAVGARGEVVVTGAGAQWNNQSLYVGGSSTGSLGTGAVDVVADGHVNVVGVLKLWNAGTLTIDGGSVTTDSIDRTVGILNHNDGALTVNGGTYSQPLGPLVIEGSAATKLASLILMDGTSTSGIRELEIGNQFPGTLSLEGNATANVNQSTTIGRSGGQGQINLNNGTLTTGSLFASPDQLTGTGTVNTHGLVSDINLVFDQTRGVVQQIQLDSQPDQNITIQLDANGTGSIGAGYRSAGSLTIADGLVVAAADGVLGYRPSSTGTATISGANSTWSVDGELLVGRDGSGTLVVAGGGKVTSAIGIVAKSPLSVGVVTVTGAGSTWHSDSLTIGEQGTGALNIEADATVNVTSDTYVGRSDGAGSINFIGGTLATGGLLAAPAQMTGTGTIHAHGIVTDSEILFDQTQGLQQSLVLDSEPNQNVTINLNVDGTGSMGAGYLGQGSLTVADGVAIQSTNGVLGYHAGSQGIATISGSGSAWTVSGNLVIGRDGTGTLVIAQGGRVAAGNIVVHPTHGTLNWEAGTIRINGGTISGLHDGDGNIFVGATADQTLELNAGATLNGNQFFIGGNSVAAGSKGALSLTNNAVVKINNSLKVWNEGAVAESGSQLIVSSDAAATIPKDPGLYVGVGTGDGIVTVIGGGTLSTSRALLGYHANSTGNALVTGAGSIWNNSGVLRIGESGTGRLTIEEGASVSNTNGTIGQNSSGVGEVNVVGENSTWINSGSLLIGIIGSGSLTVTDGAHVTSAGGGIAISPGSHGAVTVTGNGSKWTSSLSLLVGGSGTGSLSVAAAAEVLVGGETTVGALGEIQFSNGMLKTRGLLSGAAQLKGTGTVETSGLVSDVDLVFDQTYGLQQVLTLSGQPDQNIAINLDVDGSSSMGAGFRGAGSLAIRDGRTVSSENGFLGYNVGATGIADVEGPGSTWTNNANLMVGVAGSGQLNISNGGTVNSATAIIGQALTGQGTASVTGANSIWNVAELTVGDIGVGELTISSGGHVITAGAAIGYRLAAVVAAENSNGKVFVTGTDSRFTNNGTILLGGTMSSMVGSGKGELSVADGAEVFSIGGVIGSSRGYTGIVTVEGSESKWINSFSLTVGNRGKGTLTISDGGYVTSTSGMIGQGTGGNGTVLVTGLGSTWNIAGVLTIGSISAVPATVSISDRGAVSATSETRIYSQGILALDGGTFTTGTLRFQSSGGQFNWTAGTLHVGTYQGNLVNTGGILAPGPSFAVTTVTGNYTQQAAGILQIGVGGIVPGVDFERLVVTGKANLSGTLQVDLLAGFVPASGMQFDILDWGSRTGTFSSVSLPSLPGGKMWDTSQLYTSGLLTVIGPPPVPGDFDSDGDVDGADFVAWQTNFPKPTAAVLVQGDADADGDVDGADFVVWQTNFPFSPAPDASPVPEPNALAIAILALAGGWLPASRRRHRRTRGHWR